MPEDKYYESAREDIVSLIPREAMRVLDVGCGFGLMGKRLKQERGIEVVGIESEQKAINIAKGNLSKLIVGDVENLKLPFEQGYFDCIIYGDVLEHLRFFTSEGIKEIFNNAGYAIKEEKKYIRGSKSKKALNKILRGKIEYLLTEQYIVKARLD